MTEQARMLVELSGQSLTVDQIKSVAHGGAMVSINA